MLSLPVLSALALYLCTCYADPQAILIDKKKGGEQVVKMEAGEHFKPGDKSVKTKMFPDSDFESEFYCKESLGKQLTASPDGQYVGCCLPQQILVGSEDAQFMCCGKGHIMAGNKDVGYSCCPEGQDFDGKLCKSTDPPKPPPHLCQNGKELVDGKCVCPKGLKEAADGTCKSPTCSSDIFYGKCYMFKFHNGQYFGSDSGGTYYAHVPDIDHGQGVFTFCQDEKCTGNGPIGANDTVYIKDNRGRPRNGDYAGWFLGNDANGAHVGKRNNPAQYGKYSLAKFSECGKYCLGGHEWGLYYACPTDWPALTFWTLDPNVCVPIEILEVNCDFHKDSVNCNWSDECKDKTCCPSTSPHLAHMEL